ncbi:MAG: nitroreductase family protein [Pseudobdellovibrionaceae bacterium]
MGEEKNIFIAMEESFPNAISDINYYDPESFRRLVHSRRSIRKFTDEKIPEHILDECLDLALLAPNSSNLQTWKFYKIKNLQARENLIRACFSQPAAASSAELIVCVATPGKWRPNSRQMLELLKSQSGSIPKSVERYYKNIIPAAYTVGLFNLLMPFKWVFNSVVGWFQPVLREPLTSFGLSLWSVKSCALACENLMLAFRAHGFDSCPMEGFDSHRVKQILSLSGDEKIVMIIGAGRRAEGGIYGPRLRFPREQIIKTV